MIAKVAAAFILAASVAQVMGAISIPSELDNMLIRPFCERSTVKAIMDVCVIVAPELENNAFCKDLLTTANKGKIEANLGDTNDRWCSFVVLAKSTVINVKCTIGEPGVSVGPDTVTIYPLKKFALWNERTAKAGQTVVSGAFDGGATIVFHGNSKAICTWDRAAPGTDPDIDP